MVNFSRYISYFIVLAMMVACQENEQLENSSWVSFSVGGLNWTNGRLAEVRSVEDPHAAPVKQIPSALNVRSTEGKNFTIQRVGDSHKDGFESYHSYSLMATDTVPGESFRAYTSGLNSNYEVEEFYCGFDDRLASSWEKIDHSQLHIDFTMHHLCTMVRLFFTVAPSYDKVRQIRLTSLKVGYGDRYTPTDISTDNPYVVEPSTTEPAVSYYLQPRTIDLPASKTPENALNLNVSYDIYSKNEKDSDTGDYQLVRQVENTTIRLLVKQGSATLRTLEAGKYYDFILLIDPEFLYTLSNHDEPVDLVIR